MFASDRIAASAIGASLLAAAFVASGLLHDSALAGIVGLAGCVLILYAVMYDRLRSFGPKGLELFEATKEKLARRMERLTATGSVSINDAAVATATLAEPTSLPERIRAADNPDALADLVAGAIEELSRPESSAERHARVRKDDAARATQEKFSGRQR